MNGLSTIRAFQKQKVFFKNQISNLEKSNTIFLISSAVFNWFQQRMNLSLTLLSLAAFSFILLGDFSTAFAGFIAYFFLYWENEFLWFTGNLFEMENLMINFERCQWLTQIPPEPAYATRTNYKISQGKILFDTVSVKYQESLENVLNDFSFEIKPREKIGIVGRTGAGKSTVFLCLLGMLYPNQGKIEIDDINIKSIGLQNLREEITIIPQDPYLFEGKLKRALDPFEEYTENEINKVVSLTGLNGFLKDKCKDSILDMEIKENGANLSSGEKQLICIGNAILRKKNIILIDEATANIDMKTEEFVFKNINSFFKEATVLIIAHRINTVLNSDRIVVVDKGKIIETGEPNLLLHDFSSSFHELWKDSHCSSQNQTK